MGTTDPIADMLTRMRNAIMARHSQVLIPASKIKVAIVEILKDEGFIQDYDVTADRPQPMIRVWLKYAENKEPVLTSLKRISKPGRRVYAKREKLPWVLEGLGIAVVSTSKGVITAKRARTLGVGGEVLCHAW